MAILSTHGIECGIAYYNGYIASQLEEDFEVTVLSLDQSLFRQSYKPFVRKADAMIRQMAEDCASYDVVAIQLEYGIFGCSPGMIWRRLKPILKQSKRVIVVFHTFLQPDSPWLEVLQSPAKIPLMIGKHRMLRLQGKLFRMLRKRSGKSKPVSCIVQTRREEQFIRISYGIQQTYCHPLAYLSQARIDELNQQSNRQRLLTLYGLEAGDVLVGFFGFVTKYKGVETAIRAVLSLPEHYKLVIFGGTHPGAIKKDQPIDGYLAKLVRLAEELEADRKQAGGSDAPSRIVFAGHQKNPDFEAAFQGCDFVVLPYLEVGQTSSGPASIAMQLEKKALLSRTLCYAEFGRFAQKAFHMFDVGNHVELAQGFQRFEGADTREAMRQFNRQYNLATRAKCYVDAFRDMGGVLSVNDGASDVEGNQAPVRP